MRLQEGDDQIERSINGDVALRLRIPMKAIGDSGRKPITIPEANRFGVEAKRRWHFDLARTDRNRQAELLSGASGAKRRRDVPGEKGRGQGAAVPCPASARSDPGARIAASASE